MLISLHIAKTAGTAWRLHIEDNAGPKAAFDTREARDLGGPAARARAALERGDLDAVRAALAGVELLHGHAVLDFQPVFPGTGVIAWLREPKARAASEFIHLKARRREENPIFTAVHDGEAGFADFLAARGPIYSHVLERLGETPLALLPTEKPHAVLSACAETLGWRGDFPRRNAAPPDQAEAARRLIAEHAGLLERTLAPDIALHRSLLEDWERGEGRARAEAILAAGPRRAPPGQAARLRRRAGVLREALGRALGRDWR